MHTRNPLRAVSAAIVVLLLSAAPSHLAAQEPDEPIEQRIERLEAQVEALRLQLDASPDSLDLEQIRLQIDAITRELEAMRLGDEVTARADTIGFVFVQDKPIHPSQLVERLTPLLLARGDKSIFLKGDRDLPYGKVIEVLDILHSGGITQIGLVTEGT